MSRWDSFTGKTRRERRDEERKRYIPLKEWLEVNSTIMIKNNTINANVNHNNRLGVIRSLHISFP